MVKVNNLTSEVNDILMGSRSNSIGTANSTLNKNIISQHKIPASTQRDASASGVSIAEPKVMNCNYKKQPPVSRFDHS